MSLGKSNYVVCTTEWLGSNLVCGCLKCAGVAGYPSEYVKPNTIRVCISEGQFDAANPLSVSKYIDALLA